MGSRTLVVDDDDAVLRLVDRALSARGDAVTTAQHAEAALELLADAQPFDVVLTDKNMPGASGVVLLERLSNLTPKTALVLMTAYPEGGLGRLAMLDGYLAKPFRSLDVLRATIDQALERRRLRTQQQGMRSTLDGIAGALQRDPGSASPASAAPAFDR